MDGHFRRVAEGLGERRAVEVLACVAAANWRHVEHDQKYDEHDDAERQTHDHADQFAAPVRHVECDERHEREREQQAEQEAEHVRVVVDHRQQTDEEQDQHVTGEFEDLDVGVADDVPVVDDLDEQARQDTELRSSRTRLKHGMGMYSCAVAMVRVKR